MISGVVHVLKSRCRWQDCPALYGPPTTIYNRFRRWTIKGVWRRLFHALVEVSPNDVQAIDSTTAKAHRSADCLSRAGASMKNLAHSASFHALEKTAPSKPGIKQLGHFLKSGNRFSGKNALDSMSMSKSDSV